MVNQFDLAFVIDTTGSMGGFIAAAKTYMIKAIKGVSVKEVDMRVGVVEYRDHPPEESTYVTKIYPFTDIDNAQKNIDQISLGGGGDWPEAVLDGIIAACDQLDWRPNARRIMILVGDAPGHGHGNVSQGHDKWPKGCPCGKTIQSVALALEEELVTLYTVGLERHVKPSFEILSQLTGGSYCDASRIDTAIEEIRKMLQNEFKDMAFDQDILSLWNEGMHDKYELASRLTATAQQVLDSIGRLRSRNLITTSAETELVVA